MAKAYMGNIKGPTGPAGATGATGPAGPTGPAGATGPAADPLDMFPVGSVFEVKQSAGTFNPAQQFGGSWTQDTSTYLFAGIKRYWRTA